MPRIVLDSSVLVSAFLTPHDRAARLLRDPVRNRYELCLSDATLTEAAGTLLAKSTLRPYAAYADKDVHYYIRWLISQSEMERAIPSLRIVAANPKDDPVIATVVAAKAEYLVTGDRAHLLPIGEYEGIRILSPRAFLDIVG